MTSALRRHLTGPASSIFARVLLIGLALAGVTIAAFVLLRPYAILLGGDASIFLTVGRGWLHGQVPYLDAWDHKPPLIYFWSALANLVAPRDPVLILEIFSAFAIAITALVLGHLTACLSGRRLVGAGAGIFTLLACANPYLSTGGGVTELFALPAMVGAYSLLALAPVPHSRWRLLAVGGLWAIGFNSSLLAAVLGPVFILTLWLGSPAQGRDRVTGLLRALALIGSGALVVSVLIWLPLLAGGAGPAAFDILVGYDALYRASAIFAKNAWSAAIILFWPLYWPLIIIGFAKRSELRALLPGATWFFGGIGLLLWGIRLYPHYFLIVAPALALLVASPTAVRLAASHHRLVGIFLSVMGMGILVLFFASAAAVGRRATNNNEVVAYIDAHSAENSRIYVWGFNDSIYLASDRDVAGPYSYLYPLITPGYGPAASANMLAAWQVNPPALIIDSSSASPDGTVTPPLLLPHAFAQNNNFDNRTLSADLDPLRAFVASHYHLVADFEGQGVYARNP